MLGDRGYFLLYGIRVHWRCTVARVYRSDLYYRIYNMFMAQCQFYDDTEPDVCIVSVVINTPRYAPYSLFYKINVINGFI